jgi:DNA polymerase-3 subunit gamma/tau
MADQDRTAPPAEQYIVTARKWRPQRFADVVGQEHVTRTLRNAVETKRIHHAYIFNGPRGVGKTTTARIMAKAVNCENLGVDFEPCNQCSSCLEINSGRSFDVIEIDGASNNSVDDIRKLRDNAKYPPAKGRYKMYIIDEVHMLSTSAFNALLKTLEEPPKHLLFVFATTEPHKVPATILSRCQRFDFRRMQVDEIAAQLRHIATQEGITIDDESLAVIGKKGDGSMRDSQSIFDQVIAFCGKTVEYSRVNEALNLIDQEFYFGVSKAIREHDVAKILDIAREVFTRGYDLQECLSGLAEHFRNILTVLATGDTRLIEASKLHREQYAREAVLFSQADVLQFMSLIIATERDLRFAPQPRLRLEFALVQMAKMDSAIQIAELLAELGELKKKLDELVNLHPSQAASMLASLPGLTSDQQSATGNQSDADQTNGEDIASIPPVKKSATTTNATEREEHNERDKEEDSDHDDQEDKIINGEAAPQPDEQADEQTDEQPDERAAKQDAEASSHLAPAERIAAEWHRRLSASEQLDAGLKKYLTDGSMIEVECADGEFHITSNHTFVADSFVSKKTHLEGVLREEFGAEVRVVVVGGSQIEAASLFSDFFSSPTEASHSSASKRLIKASVRSSVPPAPSLNGVEGHPTTTEEARSEQSSHTSHSLPLGIESAFPNTDAAATEEELIEDTGNHALDASIRAVFGAVAVPVR